MKQMTNNLHRMRQLAVQSANSTNAESDRKSIDAEFQQLLAENNRIATSTTFNGLNVLDGTMGNSTFQVGANVGAMISIDLSSSMENDSVGATSVATSTFKLKDVAVAVGVSNTTYADNDFVIGGEKIAAPTQATTGMALTEGRGVSSAIQLAAAINLQNAKTGITATAKAATEKFSAAVIAAAHNEGGTLELKINDIQILNHTGNDPATDAAGLLKAINDNSNDTGVTASLDAAGDMTLTAADGRDIEIKEVRSNARDRGYLSGTTGSGNYKGFYKGSIELRSSSATVFKDPMVDVQDIAENEVSGEATTNIDTSKVTSVLEAEDAIKKIDAALSDIDTFRGNLGAVQARFESAVASLSSSAENLSAARSRIMDADFALETAKMTKAQILQQAGIAMVSQANSIPNGVLSLLKG
jgi:flagellin